jgi:hypothetical protein
LDRLISFVVNFCNLRKIFWKGNNLSQIPCFLIWQISAKNKNKNLKSSKITTISYNIKRHLRFSFFIYLISPNLAKYTCECSSLAQHHTKWKKRKEKKKTLVGQVFDFANNCHFQFFLNINSESNNCQFSSRNQQRTVDLQKCYLIYIYIYIYKWMKYFQSFENILSYLYVHYTYFKCTTYMCKKIWTLKMISHYGIVRQKVCDIWKEHLLPRFSLNLIWGL